MKYIVQDSEGKKMVMTVISSIPQLPEGFEILGKAEELPEAVSEITEKEHLEQKRAQALNFLNETDKLVIRHRDQLELGISTKLSAEEYAQLLKDRQTARDNI